ncbi:hypothetical protein L6164_000120 [Bauhinia variegata]|uniref:Uncharacterized protein n=1 Tax=Bauhinia variegata TaxID=167791 RepID=A0ACB9Q4R4_BAUVA|nr:hypothetical protein L6164_000120 [Bauhinia variegata]
MGPPIKIQLVILINTTSSSQPTPASLLYFTLSPFAVAEYHNISILSAKTSRFNTTRYEHPSFPPSLSTLPLPTPPPPWIGLFTLLRRPCPSLSKISDRPAAGPVHFFRLE